jgi:hypothetical protein
MQDSVSLLISLLNQIIFTEREAKSLRTYAVIVPTVPSPDDR